MRTLTQSRPSPLLLILTALLALGMLVLASHVSPPDDTHASVELSVPTSAPVSTAPTSLSIGTTP